MTSLDDIALFASVIQHGGFSHAAKYLKLSNGLVSRRIAQLELDLGVTLIKRTTRQIELTQEGRRLAIYAKRLRSELDAALQDIHEAANTCQGTIRISAPLYLGRRYIFPILNRFLTQFKDIKLDLDLSNETHDLIKHQFDLIIRGAGYKNSEHYSESNLKIRSLLKSDIQLYASKSYLQKNGTPKTIFDLCEHRILSHAGDNTIRSEENWHYVYKNKKSILSLSPNLYCNDFECILEACLSGQGIAKIPAFLIQSSSFKKNLIPILKAYSFGKHEISVLYPSQQALPKRVRYLLDFLLKEMKIRQDERKP